MERQATQKEAAVRQLIAERHIEVIFQPIWDVLSQSRLGFEALVRPAEKYLFTGTQEAFVLAEQMGLAPALDAVCLQAILSRAEELPPGALLFINAVPETLTSDVLAGENLVLAVSAAGLAPSQVVLDLTERSMKRFDIIVREVKRLQSLGFRIALGNMGAGNAGLDVLRRLSVEFVKIDRMVVVQAMTDARVHAMVTGAIEIARAMRSYVIAEGIETLEALNFVYAGVRTPSHEGFAIQGVQGYLIGRPEIAPWANRDDSIPGLLALARDIALRRTAAVAPVRRSVQGF